MKSIIKSIFSHIECYWKPITVLILMTITLLSLLPQAELPAVPGTDKTHHFIAYGALMFAVGLKKPKSWWMIGLFFVAWSGAIELIQPYVNRYGEWLDLSANTGGLITGFIVAQIIKKSLK
ncbi:VanZ family protein [Photobacterium damselae]